MTSVLGDEVVLKQVKWGLFTSKDVVLTDRRIHMKYSELFTSRTKTFDLRNLDSITLDSKWNTGETTVGAALVLLGLVLAGFELLGFGGFLLVVGLLVLLFAKSLHLEVRSVNDRFAVKASGVKRGALNDLVTHAMLQKQAILEPSGSPRFAPVESRRGASPNAGEPSVEARLSKLRELREKGLITEEDYSRRRSEILQRI